MKSYHDLIDQTFDFPTQEFAISNYALLFNQVNLMKLIETYGTPLRISYLPKIEQNITLARKLFTQAMRKRNYQAEYNYCYCTKSSHFRFILEEVLKQGAHLETSSAFDIPMIETLYRDKKLNQNQYIICNGFKVKSYIEGITHLIQQGFVNCVPILDNAEEFQFYHSIIEKPFQIGIRVAADEEPNFEFYTSRLGMRYSDVLGYYQQVIAPSQASLTMLHFFIHTGIKDTAYFWSELSRFLQTYCMLRKHCDTLHAIDIGGGFPIKNSLQFAFDYKYMIEQIVENVQWICNKNHVPLPNIFTEFGTFTVGETGAVLYEVLAQKRQNDKELWYMIDGSFITHLPDTWALNHKYILLPINHWNHTFHRVNLGGLTCDSMDYYNSEAHISEVFMPIISNKEKFYLGFFHTGAYQEALSGYGGIQHCLLPSPKHIIIHQNSPQQTDITLFKDTQSSQSMLDILGYAT